MASEDGGRTSSLAWEHFKRTGVILPGHHGEIAARLGDGDRSDQDE